MTSVWGKNCLALRSWASKTPNSPLSYQLDQSYYEDFLVSNQFRLYKTPIFVISALLSKAFKLDIAQYTQKNLNQIIQSVFQAQTSKKRSFENKIKAKSLNVYCDRSYMECDNFCPQCKDYFVITEIIRQNRIPFAAFFL